MKVRQTMGRERTISYSQMEDVCLLKEGNYVPKLKCGDSSRV